MPFALCAANFYPVDKGGWHKPIRGVRIHIPCRVHEEHHDCAIINDEDVVFVAGENYRIRLEFLQPHLVLPKIAEGQEVFLCVGMKDIARLIVEDIQE